MGFPFHPSSHGSETQAGTMKTDERDKEIEKALSYVDTVRDTLEKDNPGKYREFLDILIDFNNHKGFAEVVSRMTALFRDCPAPGLLTGFNAFLPEWYKTQVGADELAARVVTDLSLDKHNDDHMSE